MAWCEKMQRIGQLTNYDVWREEEAMAVDIQFWPSWPFACTPFTVPSPSGKECSDDLSASFSVAVSY